MSGGKQPAILRSDRTGTQVDKPWSPPIRMERGTGPRLPVQVSAAILNLLLKHPRGSTIPPITSTLPIFRESDWPPVHPLPSSPEPAPRQDVGSPICCFPRLHRKYALKPGATTSAPPHLALAQRAPATASN